MSQLKSYLNSFKNIQGRRLTKISSVFIILMAVFYTLIVFLAYSTGDQTAISMYYYASLLFLLIIQWAISFFGGLVVVYQDSLKNSLRKFFELFKYKNTYITLVSAIVIMFLYTNLKNFTLLKFDDLVKLTYNAWSLETYNIALVTINFLYTMIFLTLAILIIIALKKKISIFKVFKEKSDSYLFLTFITAFFLTIFSFNYLVTPYLYNGITAIFEFLIKDVTSQTYAIFLNSAYSTSIVIVEFIIYVFSLTFIFALINSVLSKEEATEDELSIDFEQSQIIEDELNAEGEIVTVRKFANKHQYIRSLKHEALTNEGRRKVNRRINSKLSKRYR